MVAEVLTGVQLLASAFNTAKGLLDIRDATLRDQAVFTLQRQILEAQAEQFALVKRVGELEAEVAGHDKWDTEKNRYELVQTGSRGVLVYRIKPEAQGSQPEHCICARCYEDGKKSLLQEETTKVGMWNVLVCARCKTTLYVDGGGE